RGSERNNLDEDVVRGLKEMLDHYNVLVKSFRMAREKMIQHQQIEVKMRLIGRRNKDGRRYNLPSTSEVAALVVGDFDDAMGSRDIIVENRSGRLQRINELNASYLALHYPILFPYGKDGYREDIPFSCLKPLTERSRKFIIPLEFFKYRMHDRDCEFSSILSARRLYQQFVVDAYTMVEGARLRYIRFNQKNLRTELYNRLSDAVLRGDTDPGSQGKRIILPSSFTGGARYMVQNYQDAMAICRWTGYPDIFITFTCNPKWPEISRFLAEKNLNPEDRPDIICRVFKTKLDQLMRDVRHNKMFGDKRGLPHAHILLFLAKEFKIKTTHDIDKIISAEIPDEATDPFYYAAVRDHMMHGPCGSVRPNSPCMANDCCTKHFPKKLSETTTLDEEGYPRYRRRDNGRTIEKNGIPLDNRYVVPHNRKLLMKYGAHINMEWCNQSRSIKYLFKYVNKGNDRVIATFHASNGDESSTRSVDEVKMYYDCRYVSSCEAAWRLLEYEIQYKHPSVERLNFHLENEHPCYYPDEVTIDEVVKKNKDAGSKFLAWMEANKKYPEARKLTYVEAPTKFTWHLETNSWEPKKGSNRIARLYFVPPGAGDIYYLRCLINVVRGATCHRDYMKLDGVHHDSYRDACFSLGLVEDDKEYIEGIIEASQWSSANSLRNLFATLLSSDTLGRPEFVWESCWPYLSDDILYNRRRVLQHP
ncbi:Unknown protein, partial [Striga hermonthica]